MIESVVNTFDQTIAACFVLAAIFLRSRDSAVCLLLFGAFHTVFYLSETGLQVHLTMAAINALAIYLCTTKVGRVLLAMSVFQYIMAIDAYLLPSAKTLLWYAYPYAAFTLNLLLLGVLGQGWRNGVSNSSFDCVRPCWLRHIRCLPSHQNRNAGR